MERLTDKNHNAINKCGEYSSCYSCHKEICYIKEIKDKLGELEDVLEKYDIENLEEYISALMEARKLAIEEKKTLFKRYIEEVTKREKIEQQLAELKQNANIPKYQIGQKVFIILDGTVKETNIDSIIIFAGNELSYYCKYVDGKRIYLELAEDEIFTTKEEAEQKLAEIKGEKDE